MAQVRALVRKLVLEELLASEVLEVGVIDPAFAYAFIGQAIDMLEQKKPDYKPCRNSRPTTVAVGAISSSIKSQSILPASCASSCLMLMIWSSREQITRSSRLVLLRSHCSLQRRDRITPRDSWESRKRNCKLSGAQTLKSCNLNSPKPPENDSRSVA
jgi:hypothetical protein